MSLSETAREIAAVPAWLYAALVTLNDGFRALAVYASALVDEDDPIYRPVVEFLAGECAVLDSVDLTEDPDMMFGSASTLIYSVFPVCPGPLVAHACVHDRVRV